MVQNTEQWITAMHKTYFSLTTCDLRGLIYLLRVQMH